MKDYGVEWLGPIPAHWEGLPTQALGGHVPTWSRIGPPTFGKTPEFASHLFIRVDFISAEAVSEGRIDFEKQAWFHFVTELLPPLL